MNLAEALVGDAVCQRFADAEAIRHGDRTLTRGRLGALVNRYGNALRTLGAGPGDKVVLVMHDSPELVAAFLGALKGGAISVPLSTRIAVRDLAHVIADSDARLLVADGDYCELCSGALERAGTACRLVLADGDGTDRLCTIADRSSDVLAAAPRDAGDEAFWLYSSGTTGTPKGIVHTHKDSAPLAALQREVLELDPGDVVYCTSKLSFAYSLAYALIAPLHVGAASLLDAEWPSPERTVGLIERHRPRAVFSTPSLYRSMVRNLDDAGWRVLADVGYFVSAGEHVPPALARQWRERTGNTILDGIGTSETVSLICCAPIGEGRDGSVGFPLPGVEVRVLDDAGAEVEAGETGHLWVRHPFQFDRYANLAKETNERLLDGWLMTGDLFRRDGDGYCFHLGRRDDRLKVAGQWVRLQEIEEAAISHPSVAESAAVAIEDADGMRRVALFIVPADTADASDLVDSVRDRLAKELPRFKNPRWVRVVAELPRTSTGKVQKFRLRDLISGASEGR
jgi:benzoate-CoA ligase